VLDLVRAGQPLRRADDGESLVPDPVEREQEVLRVEEDLELGLRERPHPKEELSRGDLVAVRLPDDRDPERQRAAPDVPHPGER
jgi:hypothetical protein